MSDDSPVQHDGSRDSSVNKQDEPLDRFSQMQKEFEAMMHGDHGIKPPRSGDNLASFSPANHYHIPDFDSPDPDSVNDQVGKQFLLTLLLGISTLAVAAVIAAIMLLPPNRGPVADQANKSGVASTPAASEADTPPTLSNPAIAEQPIEPTRATTALHNGKQSSTVTKQIEDKPAAISPISPTPPLQQTSSPTEWVIYLASFTDPKAVQAELSSLKARGIRSGSSKTMISGRLWYRVYARGYHSAARAKAAIPSFAKSKNYDSPWVAKKPD